MKHLKVGCMVESNWYKNEGRLRLSFQNTNFLLISENSEDCPRPHKYISEDDSKVKLITYVIY